MKITVRHQDDVVVAELQGRLNIGAGDEDLRQLVDNLLADGHRRILLDLSQVPSIDSSGIGELVASLKVTRELNGQLKILSLPEGIRHVLGMAQILPMFEVYKSESEALASFEPTARDGAEL